VPQSLAGRIEDRVADRGRHVGDHNFAGADRGLVFRSMSWKSNFGIAWNRMTGGDPVT
jgi:hypothetical protein